MDQALKQRLVGALVITALAAIFVPMFFEDSVDDSRREINQSDLAIPAAPEQSFSEDNPIPQSPQQVLHAPEGETAAESGAEAQEEDSGQEALAEDTHPPQSEQSLPLDEVAPAAEKAAPATKPKVKAETAIAAAKKKPQPAKKVTPQPQPVAEPTPAQAKQNTAPPAKAPELQRWVVQLGSFTKKDNADGLVNKLRAQGFNAYGDTIEVEGKGTMFRVRIGPELDKKRAQATQKKLQQQNAMGSIVLAE
jgi:DedD protein